MSQRDVRYARPAAALFAAAVLTLLLTAPPARAQVTAASVTSPAQNAVIAGSYDSDGNATGFTVTPRGSATTNCSDGWQSLTFTIKSGSQVVKTLSGTPTSNTTWSNYASSSWDTRPLQNGIYSISFHAVEKDTLPLNCTGDANNTPDPFVTVKVANPATAPEWETAPAPASDGSGRVTLKWKKNPEVDILEYQIIRSGPDGTKVAHVNAGTPGLQSCSYASSVYTCDDTSFGADYTGSYSYALAAVRERPAYNSSESDPYTCQTTSKPCVVSASSGVQAASLVAPTPTPAPTEQPTADPGSPPQQPVVKPSKTARPSTNSGGGLSFGGGGGGGGGFYSGTYSTSLPYQPRTLIIGGGRSTPSAQGYTGDVVSETAPDYRTIMLPIAGGMLAFLGAAHVRRLMFHL